MEEGFHDGRGVSYSLLVSNIVMERKSIAPNYPAPISVTANAYQET